MTAAYTPDMILMRFPNAADSPTVQPDVRIRYTMHRRAGRTTPVLIYAHGTRELTPEAWAGFRAADAA